MLNTLYNSDAFVVVHIQTETGDCAPALKNDTTDPTRAADLPIASVRPRLKREGFEIVDKRSGRELYLEGAMAEVFSQQILAWRDKVPTEEEVDETLDGYAQLGQITNRVH